MFRFMGLDRYYIFNKLKAFLTSTSKKITILFIAILASLWSSTKPIWDGHLYVKGLVLETLR